MQKHAIVFVCTPKQSDSASMFLADLLVIQLREHNIKTEVIRLFPLMKEQSAEQKIISLISYSDIIIFSSPVYADGLPYLVVKAMEIIAPRRNNINSANKKRFLAISNCGFPEARHNELAIGIFREFAKEMNFKWLGGVAVGMGLALVTCKPIEKITPFFISIKRSLKLIADSIADETDVPDEAFFLASKPMMPIWLYVFIGSIRWVLIAIGNGVINMLKKPYQPYVRNKI
jgi:hypothetical protein